MENCACIKDTAQAFDFYLESFDCKTLILRDLSNWMEEEPYTIPETHPVTITLPCGTNIETTFNPKSITKYTGQDLSTSECLEDGIYCFKVDSCGYLYTRHKAVTCILECQLDTLITKAETDNDWTTITELSNLIESIKINAELGRHKEAGQLYKITNKKLSRLECSCHCS